MKCNTKRRACLGLKNRRWLTIQRLKSDATVGDDGIIDKTLTSNWETYTRRAFSAVAKRGTETNEQNQLTALRTSIWETRYSKTAAGITSQMRALLPYDDSTRTLNIEAVIDVDYAAEVIQIHCTENADG
jgi:head-tail adaptor